MVITGALFVSVIFFVIVVAMTMIAGRPREWNVFEDGYIWHKGIRPIGMRIFGVLFTLVVFGGLVIFSPWVVSSWGSQTTATATKLTSVVETQEFGLKPDVSYPLVLGARGDVSETDAKAWRSLFGGYAQFESMSGSSVTVTFTHGDTTSWLDVPVSKIQFKQREDETPSVKFTFVMAEQDSDGTVEGAGLTRLTQTTTTRYAPCVTKWINLTLYCANGRQLSKQSVMSELDPNTIRHGLTPLVDANMDVVTIVLSHEMYKKLTG